jgi:hypothetical protein
LYADEWICCGTASSGTMAGNAGFISPEAFPPKERMAQYFEDYAKMLNAPVRTGVEVRCGFLYADEWICCGTASSGTMAGNAGF